MNISMPTGLGAVISLLALVVVVVLVVVGQLSIWPIGALLAMLAIARLV